MRTIPTCQCEERSDEAIQLDCHARLRRARNDREGRSTSPASARPSPIVHRPRAERGFTIVELVVAASLTVVMAAFIVVIVRNVTASWSRAGARLGADAQARIVLDQLQLDLEGALYRDDGNVWFAADILNGSTGGATTLWDPAARNPKPTGGLSLQLTTTDIANARFGTAGVWLRFFTTKRGSNNSAQPETVSAPVAVGYQIIRRPVAVNQPASTVTRAYLLHRTEARPASVNGRIGVLEAGFNITSGNYTTGSGTNTGTNTGDPRSIQVPGTNTIPRNLDSVIAENVIDFGVRCYVRDATVPGGLRLIFPALAVVGAGNLVTLNPGYTTTGFSAPTRLRASLPPPTPITAQNFQIMMPDVVDIMVRILTDDGAEQIANIEKVQNPALTVPQKYNGNAQQWWWGIAEENSRIYTRRIVLNAKPL
ncbi:MAG: hypothetical protein Q8N18_04525 [Opitutaceae bacterium]|nr:hypothetical protein [Opitutaceae bacterium]